jgi:hypothetical protein
MEIDLYNCPTPVTVTGYSGLVQTAAMILADASGNVNATIWPNDVITCNGTTGQNLYGVTYVVNGVPSGTVQCYSILSTQQNWNITTQQPVSCVGGPPNPQDATYTNLVVNGNLSLAHALVSLTSSSLNGELSALGYGAKCDGSTDDTAAFIAAATAANALYVAHGAPIAVTAAGNCVIGGSVTYGNGVQFKGPFTVTIPVQTGYTFVAQNADNVAWDGITFNVVSSPGGDFAGENAIQWIDTNADSLAHAHVAVRNCTFINSVWGIYIQYAHGTGSLTDVNISGNTILSPSVYTNGDGIHVDGRVSSVTIQNNRITNRNDAGIGLTTNGSYILSGFKVDGNILLDDRVGLDDSGAINGEWSHNYVSSTTACSGCQNPAFRQIYFTGYPTGVHTHDNYFQSGANGGSSATVKIDPAQTTEGSWPNLASTFENNQIDGPNAPLYVRGNGISVSGNSFLTGGAFTLDYDGTNNVATDNITIGTNKWMASGSLVAGAGCALYGSINVMPQQVLGTLTLTNFSCLGTQTFNVLGNVTMTGTVNFTGSSFFQVFPGPSAAFSMNIRNILGANAFILDSTGNANFPNGTVTASSYVQGAGFNTPNGQVIPSGANGFHGTSGKVQFSDGTGVSGNCAEFNTEGSVTDFGSPCVIAGTLTTTAAASDDVTLTGMTAGGHCAAPAPTNASAATNVATTYISAKASGSITVTHAAVGGMTFDITCWPN